MTKKKELVKSEKEKTVAEIQAEDLGLSSQSLNDQAQEKYDENNLNAIKQISYYISKVGLSMQESCILSNVDPKEFEEKLKEDKLLKRIIEFKKLQYKKDLMLSISRKGRSGDDKIATWLLESKFPSEFGKKKKGGDNDDDMMAMAIEFVQKNGDNSPLISERSSRALVVKKGSGSGPSIIKKLSDILS